MKAFLNLFDILNNMTKEKLAELEHESTVHTPFPMSEKVIKLTQKDLMEIVEQERGEIEK